jgi:hypothetical protein
MAATDDGWAAMRTAEARLAQWTISRQHCAGSPGALPSAVATRPARHSLALNLSAKRRLCDTVGERGIVGITRCCAILSRDVAPQLQPI